MRLLVNRHGILFASVVSVVKVFFALVVLLVVKVSSVEDALSTAVKRLPSSYKGKSSAMTIKGMLKLQPYLGFVFKKLGNKREKVNFYQIEENSSYILIL